MVRLSLLILVTLFGQGPLLPLASAQPVTVDPTDRFVPLYRFEKMPVDLVGLDVVPHTYSKEIRYFKEPDEALGSLVRLVLAHRDPRAPAVELQLLVHGKKPSELLIAGELCWYETPENLSRPDSPYLLGPGKIDVFTLNARSSNWGSGKTIQLTLRDAVSSTEETFPLRLTMSSMQLSQIIFLPGPQRGVVPEGLLFHVLNRSGQPGRLSSVRLYAPSSSGMDCIANAEVTAPFTDQGIVPAKDRSGARASLGPLPLTRGLIEIKAEHPIGTPLSLWAHLRFKVDRFDIGAGWLDIPTPPGVVPVTRESFLKLLRRMHINLAHIENIQGYTDSLGPDGLYTRYPLLMMSGFSDIDRYNSDEWVARIHGVDALGEPQMGKTPMESYDVLKSYDRARYPTTVTLSDDQGFRYYAGLSDFPHFDAYRVTAPAMDAWIKYDRGDGHHLFWGAPLEGIGEMTRTLKALSRPAPIALWSQNVHEGWGGLLSRKRTSPTPDEILLQAYEGVANGALSIYWYSLQSWSLLKFRDAIDETTRIGREIRLLEDVYLSCDAYSHERRTKARKPDLDLNALVGPDGAVLFAMDLSYHPDGKAQVFRFSGQRPFSASFNLPQYLLPVMDLFRVNADGLFDVKWSSTPQGVALEDQVDVVSIYVATRRQDLRQVLSDRLLQLKSFEESLGFDPGRHEADFQVLLKDLGYQCIEEVGKKQRKGKE